jgi:hypothetical protein
MEDFSDMFWSAFSIPVLAIIGSFVYVIVQTLARARVRELEVRERIAMIERGLVPPPEKDPNGFDRAMYQYDRARTFRDRVRDRDDDWDWRPRRGRSRYRSAGVTLMGVGFGLMLMLAVTAGEPHVAVGVGGFLVVMGLAFLLNSFIGGRPDWERYPYPPPPPPSHGPMPPAQGPPPPYSS